MSRLHLEIRGRVQGLGFRPFVWNLARELRLKGWVRNTAEGVQVELEGPAPGLDSFLRRLQNEPPPLAVLETVKTAWLPRRGYRKFQILKSAVGKKSAGVLPDLATCAECLREITDPQDRRFRYPFTNCIRCGPRFSILQGLPYDRENTTMHSFKMCEACGSEYGDPQNRRFHAQPNACPDCGPALTLRDARGKPLASREEALRQAETLLCEGGILALKGLGGFHLMVDARNEAAVQCLRERKGRPDKALAVMVPDWATIERWAEISPLEKDLLLSAAAPIVLVKKRKNSPHPLAPGVAPDNPNLGILLPYTPLHYLLMKDLGFPLVATSGNRSEEPICTDLAEALERLRGIADFFLDHNRPIARPVEDSVAKLMAGAPMLLRRSRGYAPLPFPAAKEALPCLATGAQLKNTVALHLDREVLLSQHLGDLETLPARRAFEEVLESFQRFYEVKPRRIVCDLHPDYASTHWARQRGQAVLPVQHHHAHVVSCMAEHGLKGTVLGVAWDGAGYGPDGTLWGGEFLRCTREGYERLGHLRAFPLPGGERAIREPRRAALGLLYEIFGAGLFQGEGLPSRLHFSEKELGLLRPMLAKRLNCPRSSGAGRLFDAVAALINLKQRISFEGQAAMAMEFFAEELKGPGYPLPLRETGEGFILDWEPMVRGILRELRAPQPDHLHRDISRKFHRGLIEGIGLGARRAGEGRVILTGGCFQNRLLLEGALARLREEGLDVYWHQRVPPNDGGIALGQAVIACA